MKLFALCFVPMIELTLLGLISLLLAQWARWISEICVNSSLFSSKFYTCSEDDNGIHQKMLSKSSFLFLNESDVPPKGIINNHKSHQCGEVTFISLQFELNWHYIRWIVCHNTFRQLKGHEPFVSLEGLEQLHRFLFVLGITHVLYSCLAVGLAMSKVNSSLWFSLLAYYQFLKCQFPFWASKYWDLCS